MFTPCLFLVYCLHNETGARGQPPSCRSLNLFFLCLQRHRSREQGSASDAIWQVNRSATTKGAGSREQGDRSRSREHRSRSKTPKSCSEPDHFRPPPLEKKVVSGPGRQAQNRYITPTLRVSHFYLYLHHVQRFNG